MPRKMLSFGEAMVRFLPVEPLPTPLPPSAKQDFISTLGGDEMNVCLDIALLGVPAEWVSVLPDNQWGHVIKQSAVEAGVDVPRVTMVEDAEIGVFFVLPQQRTVEFQRRNSAFARQQAGLVDWAQALKGVGWMHATGITPAISTPSHAMWASALQQAVANDVPISFDLNHRPQLGPLDALWLQMQPFLAQFRIIILSVGQITALAPLEGYPGTLPGALKDNDDRPWRDVMRWFHKRWAGPAVACCFKRRGVNNVQRRWACIVNDKGEFSSCQSPVWHAPKEETGGGSAWAAGMLYGLLDGDNYVDPRSADLTGAVRSGDLLSALCQESVGDHSTVRLAEFEKALQSQPTNAEAYVTLTPAEVPTELRDASFSKL